MFVFKGSFSEADRSGAFVTIVHGLDTRQPIVQIFDGSRRIVGPNDEFFRVRTSNRNDFDIEIMDSGYYPLTDTYLVTVMGLPDPPDED